MELQDIQRIALHNGITPSVHTPSVAFAKQWDDIKPCHDLMGGTESMRKAGAKYIVMDIDEPKESHKRRVDVAVLNNIYAQTVSYCRGQVFSRQVALDDMGGTMPKDTMQRFTDWSEDVDRRGTNLTSWASEVFGQGLVDGVTFCLVDYPRIDTRSDENGAMQYLTRNGEWAPKTIEAVQQEGWRPYLVHIPAGQVLDCRAEWVNGHRAITHFRYHTDAMEPDPDNLWGEVYTEYIHALWPGRWQTWRKRKGDGDFLLIGEGVFGLPEIPLAVFMAGQRRTDFTARPALMDLAHMNIALWQADSDHKVLMLRERRNSILISGVSLELDENGKAKNNMPLSPSRVYTTSDAVGVHVVGSDPAAVSASIQDMEKQKEAMSAYGLQLLQTPTGTRTATQVERETRENNSTLRNWALDFQDFLENCLHYVGQWWGLDDGPSAKVNDEFAQTANIEYLMRLYDKQLISRETMTTLMVRAGILPDDFNYDDENVRLAQNVGTSAGPDLSRRLQNLMDTVPRGTGNSATNG